MAVIALTLLVCSIAPARGPWLEWKDCRLEENDSNDGDSFHVKAGGKEYILRLYLVDAPESDAGFPLRVAEQGKYFGISPAQSVQLGEEAAKFVGEKLAKPFSVRTSKQNAMGRSNSPRFYAFVQTSEGDLGEMLVANGLARVHGVAPAASESFAPKEMKANLRRLEAEAKRLKIGGWGVASGRMNARVASAAGKKPMDSFDAFFHPDRALATPVPAPAAPSLVAAGTRAAKRPIALPAAAKTSDLLDPNLATIAELVRLPGIGPVLAQRIIEARPFKSADGLRQVKGIGKKKFAQIRPRFEPGL
ncbi:MAG: helix-hairpin-helix domain-containing protein [Chthoniobacterales bacterium]